MGVFNKWTVLGAAALLAGNGILDRHSETVTPYSFTVDREIENFGSGTVAIIEDLSGYQPKYTCVFHGEAKGGLPSVSTYTIHEAHEDAAFDRWGVVPVGLAESSVFEYSPATTNVGGNLGVSSVTSALQTLNSLNEANANIYVVSADTLIAGKGGQAFNSGHKVSIIEGRKLDFNSAQTDLAAIYQGAINSYKTSMIRAQAVQLATQKVNDG